jgi:hypothetical protein
MIDRFFTICSYLLVLIGVSAPLRVYLEWQEVRFVLPINLWKERAFAVTVHSMFLAGLGLLGAMTGWASANRKNWAPSLIGFAGGASIAASACSIYTSGTYRLELISRAISNNYPVLVLRLMGGLIQDIANVILWLSLVIILSFSSRSVGFTAAPTSVRLRVASLLLISLIVFFLFRANQ